MRKPKFQRILKAINHFILFFLMVAFLISCCMMLFVSTFSETLEIALTNENLEDAAKITFVNVLLLSLLFTVGDEIRRKMMVERPVKRIKEAAERIMQGDFSVRIETEPNDAEEFDEIIAAINKMVQELSGVETLRTDFIANVSHEMKTPLAVMQNYGTLLQQPGLDDRTRIEYGKSVSDSARRLASMMTNILKLNRLENQQIYPQAMEYDLSEQICDCLLQFENVWERKDIGIETDIADGITVKADAELLSLVWNNLFSNAFKFTEAGGTVSVSLTATDHHAVIAVKDTGCGMSPEVGAHIFEKFYQGDTSHATQGNGLGLALVKRIIDILHGQISVESIAGKGTTFTVRIRRNGNGLEKNR